MKIKGFSFVFSMLIANIFCLTMASADVVYYPVTLATIDPNTGVQQQHIVYVPIDTTTGTVQGSTGTANANTNTLPSNPWEVNLSSANVTSLNQVQSQATNDDVALRDTPLPNWSGQNTTWNTAMGQEMIAPEINKDNMLKMTQHLRALGYQVPDSLDEAIASAPEKTRLALIRATSFIQKGGDEDSSPVLKAIGKISRDLENNYGFSFENIMDTSMKILDSK